MSKTSLICWIIKIGVILGIAIYFSEKHKPLLRDLAAIARVLSPSGASAETAPGEAQVPAEAAGGGEVARETSSLTSAVRSGMDRAAVERILGRPVLSQSARLPDGGVVEQASWVRGVDRVDVRFLNGRVVTVTSGPIGDLTRREMSPREDENKQAEPPSAGGPATQDLPEILKKLQGSGGDEMLKRLLDGTGEKE